MFASSSSMAYSAMTRRACVHAKGSRSVGSANVPPISLLRCEDGDGFVAWDEGRGAQVRYDTTTRAYAEHPVRPALRGSFTVPTRDGRVA